MRRLVLAALLLVPVIAVAGDWYTDNTPTPLKTGKTLPPGADATRYIRAEDWNDYVKVPTELLRTESKAHAVTLADHETRVTAAEADIGALAVGSPANASNALVTSTGGTTARSLSDWMAEVSAHSGLTGIRSPPRTVIFDTDWWTDVDDVAALRLIAWAERIGIVDIAAIGIDASFVDSPGSIDALLFADGRKDALIAVPKTTHNPGGTPVYQAGMQPYAHRAGYPATSPDAVSVYRRVLANATQKVDIIEVGYLNNLKELMDSPADAISGLTGMQLIASKVNRLWVMGGAWPSGSENNFNRTAQAKAAANAVCASWPTPITFLGYEIGVNVITGGNLIIQAPTDLLYQALSASGVPRGRSSWDPMLTYLAIVADPTRAGFSTVRGYASVNASTGANTFAVNASGPHEYVVKEKPDGWFVSTLNPILLPSSQPMAVPVATGTPIQGIQRAATIGQAQPTIPARVTAGADPDHLWVWLHADDLVDIPNGSPVSHWEDRQKHLAFRQSGAARPSFASSKNGRRAVAFGGTQALFTDDTPLPWQVTVYVRVQWDAAPAAQQTILAGENTAGSARSFKFWVSNTSALSVTTFMGGSATTNTASASAVTTGSYQTIVAARSLTAILGYLNGTAGASTAASTVDMVHAPLVLGAGKPDASSERLVAWVTELRIYDAYHDAATVAAVLADMGP